MIFPLLILTGLLSAGPFLIRSKPHACRAAAALLLSAALLAGCAPQPAPSDAPSAPATMSASSEADENTAPAEDKAEASAAAFDYSQIPAYNGQPSMPVNNNQPFFTEADRTAAVFEHYAPLDSMGRCGTAFACLSQETMPTEARGSIGAVKPSGWHTVRYAGVDGKYLYNRCHLIAYELSAENANPSNLITGTRYMNTEGMLPYENATAEHLRAYGDHVLYRVTPVFIGNDLVSRGVLMEAQSVEHPDYRFCVWCWNVQPGIAIDYASGDSSGPPDPTDANQPVSTNGSSAPVQAAPGDVCPADGTVVWWTKNGKSYHLRADCEGLKKAKNVQSGPIETCPKDDACNICAGGH